MLAAAGNSWWYAGFNIPMKPPRDNSYVGVATRHFREAADFYIKHFGYERVAELEDLISVRSPNGKRCLGFSSNPGVETNPNGIHLSFLVEDADEAFAHFQGSGVAITRGIDVGDWGAKHFIIRDPAGIELYISEQAIGA